MSLILIVEDEEKIRSSLLLLLRDAGYAPRAVGSAEEAEAHLAAPGEPVPDLLLVDVRLGGKSGVALIRELAAAGRLPPTIVLSGEASIGETVEALRLGVHDFIEKPFRRERLLQSIRNALEREALRRKVALLEAERREEPAILGASPAILRLQEAIARVAGTDARVLIHGPSGTGKELVAASLHAQSRRRGGPFVKLNCAAIAPHLVEDELFGHARGAFTDAKAPKPGLFEEAHGGTLFLDEIGDMEPGLQARLLRVLEDGRVRRLGETRDRQIDVRVIAATHRDLRAAASAGRFREDLYFRLAHLPLEVPPLAGRAGDVRLLFEHFVDRFALQHRMRRPRLDPGLFPPLERYAWPGNVRELRNLAERLVVFGTDPLTAEQLPSFLFQTAAAAGPGGLFRLEENPPALSLRDFRAQCEREYIEAVLRRTGWNFAAAARLLEIQRTYLHQKVLALGIERPARDGDEAGSSPS